MLIEGYEDGPLAAGEPLLSRSGFWSNYLLAMCAGGTGTERPGPHRFGEDGADADALSEILLDPERWPVFRVPASEGPGVVVVSRNLVGDYGIDFLLTSAGPSGARRIAGGEGEVSGTGLTWQNLLAIANDAAPTAEGVHDPDARLLLILPLLNDPDVPEGAPARISAALTAVGVPQSSAPSIAEYLLGCLTSGSWHDPSWHSPLSGERAVSKPLFTGWEKPLEPPAYGFRMTTTLRLAEVTAANFEDAIAVKVRPDQEHLVAPVVKSLAEAYVHPGIAWPRLILDGDRIVGFLMAFFDIDFAGDGTGKDIRSGLWRLNIAMRRTGPRVRPLRGRGGGHRDPPPRRHPPDGHLAPWRRRPRGLLPGPRLPPDRRDERRRARRRAGAGTVSAAPAWQLGTWGVTSEENRGPAGVSVAGGILRRYV